MSADRESIATLAALIALDAETLQLHTRALEHVTDDRARDDLELCRAEHERHVAALTDLVFELGGDAPAIDRDLRTTVVAAATALRSATHGTLGALKAMRANEQLANREYEAALDRELPAAAAATVARHLADERRHVAMIELHVDRLQELDPVVDASVVGDDGVARAEVAEVVVLAADQPDAARRSG